MKAKLSSRTIQAVRASDNPFEVVDSELKGFLLRVQPSGAMSYYFSYRNDQGKRKRYRIGNSESLSPAQARDQAILLSARVVAGEDIQAEKKRECQLARMVKSRTLDGFLKHKYEPCESTGDVDREEIPRPRVAATALELFFNEIFQRVIFHRHLGVFMPSGYMRFSLLFFASSSRLRRSSDTLNPPNLDFHL